MHRHLPAPTTAAPCGPGSSTRADGDLVRRASTSTTPISGSSTPRWSTVERPEHAAIIGSTAPARQAQRSATATIGLASARAAHRLRYIYNTHGMKALEPAEVLPVAQLHPSGGLPRRQAGPAGPAARFGVAELAGDRRRAAAVTHLDHRPGRAHPGWAGAVRLTLARTRRGDGPVLAGALCRPGPPAPGGSPATTGCWSRSASSTPARCPRPR